MARIQLVFLFHSAVHDDWSIIRYWRNIHQSERLLVDSTNSPIYALWAAIYKLTIGMVQLQVLVLLWEGG